MEEGMKEKQFKSPPPSPLLASGPRHVAKANLNCEILSTAKRFIAYLGLPSSTLFDKRATSDRLCDTV